MGILQNQIGSKRSCMRNQNTSYMASCLDSSCTECEDQKRSNIMWPLILKVQGSLLLAELIWSNKVTHWRCEDYDEEDLYMPQMKRQTGSKEGHVLLKTWSHLSQARLATMCSFVVKKRKTRLSMSCSSNFYPKPFYLLQMASASLKIHQRVPHAKSLLINVLLRFGDLL